MIKRARSNAPDLTPDERARLFRGIATFFIGLAGVAIVYGFLPGSLGPDFSDSIIEAKTGESLGHQSPTIAFGVNLISFGSASVAVMFLVKLAISLGMMVAGIWILAPRPKHLLIFMVAALLPVSVYYIPFIRSNALESCFLAAAIGLLVLGRSWRWQALAAASFLVASLFSNLLNPAYFFIIFAYILARHNLTFFRSGAVAFGVFIPFIIVSGVIAYSANVDRNSTLYISALNGIASLSTYGEPVCLDSGLLRNRDMTPTQYIEANFETRAVNSITWEQQDGFLLPDQTSSSQRQQVISCWRQMIAAAPFTFILERSSFALKSLLANDIEPHFHILQEGDEFYHILGHPSRQLLVTSKTVMAVTSYGVFGILFPINTLAVALFWLVIAGVIFYNRSALGQFRKGAIVILCLAAVMSAFAPQVFLVQAVQFRYALVPYTMAVWLSVFLLTQIGFADPKATKGL